MRSVVLSMNTTTNGRLDDPMAWFVGMTDDLYAEIERGYKTFDTILVGRVTYEEMYAYWPGAETEEGDSETNRRMATMMNAYKKYVASRTSAGAPLEWNNAELVVVDSDRDIVEFIATLKEQPGKDIHLSGGAALAQTLVRLGLVDEYRFFVHPTVSPGQTWFGKLDEARRLELVSATTYDNGVVGLYYRPIGAPVSSEAPSAELWARNSAS
jgi:dihydrofolate reductase